MTEMEKNLEDKVIVKSALNILSPKELFLIIRYYGLDGDNPENQVELAKYFGVSGSRIGQIIQKARRKMKKFIEIMMK